MEIVSTNIGQITHVEYRGKTVSTGYFKKMVTEPLFIGKQGILGDNVVDRRYHGGEEKAVYAYSQMHYAYWQKLYPHLELGWGAFGENLSISDVDEANIRIGDIFRLGEALVQVTQPRQPCYKMNIRFESEDLINQYIDFGYAGIYFRVLEEGLVKIGDTLILEKSNPESFSLHQVFRLLYDDAENHENMEQAKLVIADVNLAQSCRRDLIKHYKIEI
jgi:MOSC domain-containing protein YiiM